MNQNSAETKKNLTEALLRIYAQKRISLVTVKEICSVAGYNRSTFYNHFDDVPSMLNQIEDELLFRMEHMVRQLTPEDIFKTDKIFVAIKGIYQDNQSALSLLMTKLDSHFPQKLKSLMEAIIGGFFEEPSPVDNEKLQTAISYHFSAVIGVMSYWLSSGKMSDFGKAIDYVQEFSREGILTVIKNMAIPRLP